MSRRTITLPVTAFVHRILRARYGHGIQAGRQHNKELYQLLQVSPIGSISEQRRQLLTLEVEFHTGPALASALRQRNLEAIGLYLHEHFIREMYLHTHSQVIAGREAWTALSDFYEMHGLTEEDWKFETAYRNWLRHSDNIEKRAGNAKSVNVRPSRSVRSTVYLLLAEMDGFAVPPEAVRKTVYDDLKIPQQDARLIHAFLLQQLCGLTAPNIARRLGYTRQNAYARLKGMETRLSSATLTATRLIKALCQLKNGSRI